MNNNHNPFGSRIHLVEEFLAGVEPPNVTGLLLGQFDFLNRIGTSFGEDQSKTIRAGYVRALRDVLRQDAAVIALPQRWFAVLVVADSVAGIAAIADRIVEHPRPSWSIGKETFRLDVGIGVAVCPIHAENAENLVGCAAAALKKAREEGVPCRVYQCDTGRQLSEHWLLEDELEQAIRHDRFKVYYQPKLALPGGKVIGCEALVRWRSESGRLILPNAFIPVAESNGCIVPLTWLVFNHVARTVAGWRQLPKPFSVSINVSPKVMLHPEFFHRLRTLKAVLNNNGAGIVLELSEDSLLECRPLLDEEV